VLQIKDYHRALRRITSGDEKLSIPASATANRRKRGSVLCI